jgi:hypothetical protein
VPLFVFLIDLITEGGKSGVQNQGSWAAAGAEVSFVFPAPCFR